VPSKPFTDVALAASKERDGVLTDKELHEFWGLRAPSPFGPFYQSVMLTMRGQNWWPTRTITSG
jgi:hypothetical protein